MTISKDFENDLSYQKSAIKTYPSMDGPDEWQENVEENLQNESFNNETIGEICTWARYNEDYNCEYCS